MNRTTHDIEPEEVMASLDGELEPERAAEVAAHIEQCAECTALAAGLRSVSARLATWHVETAPASLTSTVEAASDERSGADAKAPTQKVRSVTPKRVLGLPQWAWSLAGSLAIALLIAAVSIPNLLRARVTANETSAVGSLRAIITACTQYWSTYNGFPLSLEQLGPGTPPSENAADLIDGVLAAGTKSGYRFTYIPEDVDARGRIRGFTITAEPVAPGTSGSRYFFADQSGVLRTSVDGAANDRSSVVGGEEVNLLKRKAETLDGVRVEIPSGLQSLPPPMIIRTASLSILTREFDDVRAAMEKIVGAHGGHLAQLNVGTQPGRGRILKTTARIPFDKVDAALTELKKLGRITQESQSGEEVTKQYVDLVARQVNARHIEQRLVEVLRNRTGEVNEVLEVEKEIARVREEVERMEANRKNLATQVEYATVSLELREEFEKQIEVAPPTAATLLWNAMLDGYEGAVATLLALALFLLRAGPSLLVWAALLFLPARFVWRRMRTAAAQ